MMTSMSTPRHSHWHTIERLGPLCFSILLVAALVMGVAYVLDVVRDFTTTLPRTP